MGAKQCRGSFTVLNQRGLHTRPSTELVKCASFFKSSVTLLYGGNTVSAKSLLEILMLSASCGATIVVEAVGDDAEKAVQSIVELADNKFYIGY